MNPGMSNITARIRSSWPVSDKSLSELRTLLEPVRFPKKHKLVEADKRCRSAYFIERGLTRSYWVVDGNEITTSFSEEGGIVFSMDELYYDRMSEEFVETMEPVEGFAIDIDDLKRLFEQNHELANWGRVIHQNEYRRLHRSHKERLTLPAKERYLAFLDQFPEVCKRANLCYIASYLGITSPTLSRIRKNMK